MTKPETWPVLNERIDRVRRWANEQQSKAAAAILATPGLEPAYQSVATLLVTQQYAVLEAAMEILLDGKEPDWTFQRNAPQA